MANRHALESVSRQGEPMAQDPDGDPQERISQLLTDWANRDPAARERLVPIVYEELRKLAAANRAI